ncbi:hypothetical protein BVI434_130018 [Burkholderia vietnamiensis]|nr:hypothetical protein BVI434_130018 [Burkholderia vietnamiensis]
MRAIIVAVCIEKHYVAADVASPDLHVGLAHRHVPRAADARARLRVGADQLVVAGIDGADPLAPKIMQQFRIGLTHMLTETQRVKCGQSQSYVSIVPFFLHIGYLDVTPVKIASE